MYFKRKSNVIFRDYEHFGYITDNRNFGYKQPDDDENDIGDKIVSQSGIIFLAALGTEAQTLDDLAQKISVNFTDVDIETIKIDAMEFYHLLELDGVVVSAKTLQECNEKDLTFSYMNVVKHKEEYCQQALTLGDSTQDFFDEYFRGKPQLTNLHMEITSNCNERCVHCYIPHENKIAHMEPKLFYNILEQCKKMNVLHLTLSGGEPMMHDNFVDFLRKCNQFNFSVNVLSNLVLLNNDMLEEMKRNKLLGVQVSLYSMEPDIHDSITKIKGSFEKTKESILKLWENNIPLQISCPIMKQNSKSYEGVIKWGEALNINVSSDYVIIGRYNNTTQNLCSRLSVSDVKEFINKKFSEDPYYLNRLERELNKKKQMTPNDFVCSVCHSSICISDNGDIYPCAGWQGNLLGNVKEASLSEIWDNSKKVQYLRNLRRGDFPQCIECSESEFCTMCMVRNANEHPLGDPLIVNEYFCDIAKINREMFFCWKQNSIKPLGRC